MPVPVIDPTTSVLGFRVGEPWHYQPYATNSPTSWAWTGLPPGIAANSSTGRITGPATEQGVFNASVVATNGTGPSAPLVVAIGIFERLAADNGALAINIDSRTGVVYPHGASSWKTGSPTIYTTSGDTLVLDIGFTPDGGKTMQMVDPTALTVGLKDLEPEPLIALSDGQFETMGEWSSTRYRVLCDLSASTIKRALRNYEGERGTVFDALAEVEWQQALLFKGNVVPITRSSWPFLIRITRELQP